MIATKNIFHFCLLLISIFQLIKTSPESVPENFPHQIKILYDFTHITKSPSFPEYQKMFNNAKNYISQLFYINKPKTTDNPDYADIEITPKFNSLKEENANEISVGKIIQVYDLTKRIIIGEIQINIIYENLSHLDNLNEIQISIYQNVFYILGFNWKNLRDNLIYNNYLKLPSYLAENTDAKKSIEKYFKLNNRIKEYKNIYKNYDGVKNQFSIDKWKINYNLNDLTSEKHVNEFITTEATINLFSEYPYLIMNKCDFYFFKKANTKICTRLDQKCLNESELNNNFIFYTNNKNETICYMNTEKNFKNKQCGKRAGKLYLSKINFCLSGYNKIEEKYVYNIQNQSKIPEINSINSQKIYLLTPDLRCPNNKLRTVFFTSDFYTLKDAKKILSKNNMSINEVILKDKNYFLTYLTLEYCYFSDTVQKVLSSNNLLRTYLLGTINNFIFPSFSFFNMKLDYNLNSPYVKISRFYSFHEITLKKYLYMNYKILESKYPDDYNFLPKTYSYPEDEEIITEKFKNYKLNIDDLWIIKPKFGTLGKGINIFKNLNSIPDEFLLSKYISRPHLLYNKKYDLRIYVLVTGIAPLKIYLYQEGLVRLASEKYSFDLNKINDNYIHLTNVGLNKESRKYKKSLGSDSDQYDKWAFKTYKKYLLKKYPKNPNLFDTIFNKISDIVIKTIISGEKKIYDKIENSYLEHSNFFHLFGFDILPDENFNLYLLEVNNRPQMTLYDEVDKFVKLRLIPDVLNIVGLVPFNKENPTQTFDEKTFNNVDIYQDALNNAICEFYRPTGNFKRIFPLKENIDNYLKYFEDVNEYNSLLWEYMKIE